MQSVWRSRFEAVEPGGWHGCGRRPKQWIIGGVDTHKDLHVAAVVDERDPTVGGLTCGRPEIRAIWASG
jgi:hypothetical protein